MEKLIYMDHAASTPVRKEVLDAMLPYFTQFYSNPSSVYSLSRQTRKSIDDAREVIAKSINAEPTEIYFTSGGTEADNWAIKGIAEANIKKGNHIITTSIEHHAILHPCQYLEKKGFEVTYLPVDEYGLVRIEDVKNAIKDNTVLISIMFANNEVGTIQPTKEIGKIAKEKNVIFHTDAVQAVGNVDINVKDMNIDALSLSGHKVYGPKGIGVLYVRKGISIKPILHGGAHERNYRAGTENVPGIIGLAKAMELATQNIEQKNKKIAEIRDRLVNGILQKIPNSKYNGHPTERLPGNANISFDYIEGESMLLVLDMKGICATSGSACTSGSLDPSHVLLAMGIPHEKAHGSLRLTLGINNTEEEVDYVLGVLPPIVERLRQMSPLA